MKKVLLRIGGATGFLFATTVLLWVGYRLLTGNVQGIQYLQAFMVVLCWIAVIRISRIWIKGKTIREWQKEQEENK